MKLEEFSPEKKISLCRQATEMVLERFRMLAQEVDSGDKPLRGLFEDLAGDLQKQLQEIRRFEDRNALSEVLPEEEGRRILTGLLPSLAKTSGGRGLDREAGTYLAECIGGDVGNLYRMLAGQATDEASRDFFLRSRQAVEARLEFLRHVLL